jgi:glycogen debranching enzyme
MNTEEEVRVLILNENEHKTNELFRLKKGSIIQIVLSSRLSWKNVRILTNICLNENELFSRLNYHELEWISPSDGKYDDSNRYTLISCSKSGVFHYYFTIDGTIIKENLNGEGYFQIEPELIWPNENKQILEQDCITCQSILSKSLGPISEWSSRLEVSYHSGYNMIHLTPIQRLYHVSNSSYAITDHHKLNPLFHGSFEQIKNLIDKIAKQWKMFSITDLVYNHAGNDCALLGNHPEAADNLINSPHLKPAVLLDSILMQFTRDASEDKLLSRGIPSEIKEHHLDLIRHYLINEQFPLYNFSVLFM